MGALYLLAKILARGLNYDRKNTICLSDRSPEHNYNRFFSEYWLNYQSIFNDVNSGCSISVSEINVKDIALLTNHV